MPEVLNLSDPGGPDDKSKKADAKATSSALAAKAAAKKKLLAEPDPRLQMAKLVALIVVTIAALAFIGYHFFGPKEPESRQLIDTGRSNPATGRPSGSSVAPTDGYGIPKPGEGPAPAPRFNGINPAAGNAPPA